MMIVPSPLPAGDLVPITGGHSSGKGALIFILVAILVIVMALAARKRK